MFLVYIGIVVIIIYVLYNYIILNRKRNNNLDAKRENEKNIVYEMIKLYCKKNHHSKNQLCPKCEKLNKYAISRIDNCPFMETKTFCSNCKVHCYKKDMRSQIQIVMRFSGPRMLFHHPITALGHVVATIKEKREWRTKMQIKKILLIVIGCISVCFGAIGAVLPFIPTFPFLLLAACCFTRSSEKLDRWFKGTKLYKNNLESYVKGEGMTLKTKVKIMSIITLLLSIGFIMMDAVVVGKIVLVCIWLIHMLYFTFAVKTIKEGAR